MSFKISNTLVDEANRDCVIAVQNATIEIVSATKTLNPLIPVTKFVLTGSYTVTLPNSTVVGDHKFVTAISGGGSVTIQYNNGWGSSNTITLGTVGDSVEFVSTVNGWHIVMDERD